jgi:hypothetical protein
VPCFVSQSVTALLSVSENTPMRFCPSKLALQRKKQEPCCCLHAYLLVALVLWCIMPPTLDCTLWNRFPRVLPPGVVPPGVAPAGAAAALPPPELLRKTPLWRAVARRSAWRAAELCSRAGMAWLARRVLLVLRVLRAVRGGVGSMPSCEKYKGGVSSVAREASDC